MKHIVIHMFRDLFLKTNKNWSREVVDRFIDGDDINILYSDGTLVTTYEEAYLTIPRNFSEDWIQIQYPNGRIKPYKYPVIKKGE